MRYSVRVDKQKAQYVASNIGISALKYVLGQDVSRVRRFVWLLVILMATAWMIWNIEGRVTYFLSRPSSITTEVKFKDTLKFPKITICNQNMFRSSKVFDEGTRPRKSPTVYEAVDRYLFSLWDDVDGAVQGDDDLGKYTSILSDINVTEFYTRVAHQKSTLVQGCVWKGRQCGPENFTEVFTNMGLCYQFNIRHDDLIVDKANKYGGLTLDLFVEQYDYMRDPQTQAGVLVVIADHNETHALAKEQGIGVSVGEYSTIGLYQTETVDLPPPHGECGTAELDNYPDDTLYTYQKCNLNCLTSYIKEKCGCVSVYMPGDDLPKCTLLKNVECVSPNEELFYLTGQINKCSCPSPCQSVTYSTALSLVKFSNPFTRQSALLASPASLSDVNRSRNIHAWAVLNVLNPNITDRLAQIGGALTEYKAIWRRYKTVMDVAVAELQYLMDFVMEQNLVDDVMVETNPDQEVNTTLQELQNATNCIERNDWIYEGMESKVISWSKEDDMDIDLVITEDVINEKYIYLALFSEDDVQNSVACFLKSHDIFAKFQSLVANEMKDLDITLWNSSSLTQETLDLVLEMDRVNKVFGTKTKEDLAELINDIEDVREIILKPYEKFTSDFFSDNLLKLEIYFKDLGVQESKKSPAYSAEGLVCDIGGSIGLCLGGSILTLVELFDILAVICGDKKKKATDLPLAEKYEMG